MTLSISVVVPAYNEANRLPPYLTAIRTYLTGHFPVYEVIVVDDGSRDGLVDLLRDMASTWPHLKIMQHPHNRGKGAAVRTGMLAGRGQLLLFADADGAAPIEEECRLRQAIEAGADVAVGSRVVHADDVSRQRSWTRRLVGHTFARTARAVVPISLRDPQCGFKMFRKIPGQRLFGLAEEDGYLFDIELLILASQLGFRVTEVPINWSDIPGSRLRMWRETWRIWRGLWRLRRRRVKLQLD
jgi:dolichyl-phosphate beta-glucosyltransferase